MPYTKEERKEYMIEYRIKNKEKLKKQTNEYYIKNQEFYKKYRQSDKSKKSNRISKWKEQGILCFNFDLLYDIVLSTTNCEFCQVELTTGRYNTSTTKMLDHDHSIKDKFNVRGVLCNSCNAKDVLK